MSRGDNLSKSGGPTPADVAIIDRAVDEFQRAGEEEEEALFEGLLTELAHAISQRFVQTHDDAWLTELAKLTAATEMVEAENISAIADALLFEREGLGNLRSTRFFGVRRDYVPEPEIYREVDTAGAQLIATATGYRVNGRGFPIFEGRIEVAGASGQPMQSFPFVTGGGSSSHKITNGPCPPGRYTAHGFRLRNDLGFVVDGVGYSINLDERDGTAVYSRKYFRIHPDGWPFGTKGCLGMQGDKAAQRAAMKAFKDQLDAAEGRRVVLAIQYRRPGLK